MRTWLWAAPRMLFACAMMLALVVIGRAMPATTSATAQREFRFSRILVAELDDEMINPVTAQFLVDAIDRAESENLPVVLQIDTPGGLLQSTREIVKRELSAKVPVIVYVAPNGSRAASAGVFITMAAHIAAMAPSTNIGAAHVVDVTGRWPSRQRLLDAATTAGLVGEPTPLLDPRDVMSEKIMNDTVAWVEALARLRGRNAEWARQAVEQSVSVTAEKALQLGVIDLVVEDLDRLVSALDGRVVSLDGTPVILAPGKVSVERLALSQTQRILNVLANPNVAVMLLLFGLVLLGYELTHPGLWIPGITGAICLLLAALALKMLPTNYAAILLIAVGIGLLIAELKVTSYGLLTLGGAICIFFGALALFQQPKPFYAVTVGVLLPVVLTVTGLTALLLYLVTRAQLHEPAIGIETFIGKTAEVVRPLQPSGKVFFNGTFWDAELRGEMAAPRGTKVRIIAVENMKLIVEPLNRQYEGGKGGVVDHG